MSKKKSTIEQIAERAVEQAIATPVVDVTIEALKVVKLFQKGREKYAEARSLLKRIAPLIGAGNVVPISTTKGLKLIDRLSGEKATKPTVIDKWELKEVTL